MGTYHIDGSADGSTPGRVVVDTSNYAHRRLISDETQNYHEVIPGHELRVTIEKHLNGLLAFRSQIRNNAYIKGRAAYAEALGKVIGFFQDLASDYGRLNLELLRAARFVVVNGIHLVTGKMFAIYAGAVIYFAGLIFAGIRMLSGRFPDAIPGLFGALFGAGVLG